MRDTASRNQLFRLMGGDTGEKLSFPSPVRDRDGRMRRDARAEWDWLYCLDDGLRRWISRNCMAANGLAPDDLADLCGFDYVEDWAAAFVSACRVGRGRSVSDEWDDTVQDDDGELVGPDELAARVGVNRATLRQWRRRGILPAADFELSGMPIWTVGTVREWAALTGRTLENAL